MNVAVTIYSETWDPQIIHYTPSLHQFNSCIAWQFPYNSFGKLFSASFNFLLIVKYTQMNKIWWPRLNTSSLVISFMFIPLSHSLLHLTREESFLQCSSDPLALGYIPRHKSAKLCGLKHRKPVARRYRILKILIFRFPLLSLPLKSSLSINLISIVSLHGPVSHVLSHV